MPEDPRMCEFKMHCDGNGKIEAYLSNTDLYACVKCIAGEERTTQAAVLQDIREGKPGISRAQRRPPED